MYTLTWPPMKSMRSTCVHLRPKLFPKDSLKSFCRAVSHRRKSYVPFLLPPYPKQTRVITGCSALRWMVMAPRGATGQPGIAIILLSPSSTPRLSCNPFTPAEKEGRKGADLHVELTDDIKKRSRYFSGREKHNGTPQWLSGRRKLSICTELQCNRVCR